MFDNAYYISTVCNGPLVLVTYWVKFSLSQQWQTILEAFFYYIAKGMEREVRLRKRRMGNVVINYLSIHQLGNEVIMRCYYSSHHHPLSCSI